VLSEEPPGGGLGPPAHPGGLGPWCFLLTHRIHLLYQRRTVEQSGGGLGSAAIHHLKMEVTLHLVLGQEVGHQSKKVSERRNISQHLNEQQYNDNKS
jgi:hypothetical protein